MAAQSRLRSGAEFLLQMQAYLRPLVVDDAEPHRVALASVRHDPLMPDDAFLLCAKAQNRIA